MTTYVINREQEEKTCVFKNVVMCATNREFIIYFCYECKAIVDNYVGNAGRVFISCLDGQSTSWSTVSRLGLCR